MNQYFSMRQIEYEYRLRANICVQDIFRPLHCLNIGYPEFTAHCRGGPSASDFRLPCCHFLHSFCLCPLKQQGFQQNRFNIQLQERERVASVAFAERTLQEKAAVDKQKRKFEV